MSRTQRQTNSSVPVMHYFTPASFFAATTADNRPINVKSELNAMTTPKRPPKLMDQRISIPTNGRRNSQELMSVQMITPARGAIAVPQPIKQHSRNQLQTMGQGKGAMSAKLKETTPMDTSATVVFATPPRRNASNAHSQHRMQQQSIRHEHTASILIPSRRTLSATFMRYTPPTTFSVEGDFCNEVATLYAGSKFIESPSAKSLPLPPSDWLETNRQLTKQKIVEETVQTMSEELVVAENPVFAAPLSTESNNENFIPGTWSPPTTVSTNKSPSGIRMHPLNLISAAVMSS